MKKYIIILFLLISVPAWATEVTTSFITNTNADGIYCVVGSTPTFVTDATPVFGADLSVVGKATSMTLTNVASVFYFVLLDVIPSGATISSAYLSLSGQPTGLTTTGVKASIYVENDGSADAISGLNATTYAARRANAVSGSVAWDDATIINGKYNQTPEIKTLIQPLATAGAISSVMIVIEPTAGCADPAAYGFEANYNYNRKPALTIAYTTSGGGGGSSSKQQVMMMW